MKRLTTTAFNPVIVDIISLIVRLFIGFAMITHSYPKLQKLIDGGEIEFFSFLGMGAKISLILAVFAEFVCSIFIILGLFTRVALFFLIFTMAVAGFVVLGSAGFDKQELSLLYLCVYLLLFATGAGRFSVDGLIAKRHQESKW